MENAKCRRLQNACTRLAFGRERLYRQSIIARTTKAPTASAGATRRTIWMGGTPVIVDVKITTAATADIVRPYVAAIDPSTPRSIAPERSAALNSGSTAFENATLGAVPEPQMTASSQGKNPAASFPSGPLLRISET